MWFSNSFAVVTSLRKPHLLQQSSCTLRPSLSCPVFLNLSCSPQGCKPGFWLVLESLETLFLLLFGLSSCLKIEYLISFLLQLKRFTSHRLFCLGLLFFLFFSPINLFLASLLTVLMVVLPALSRLIWMDFAFPWCICSTWGVVSLDHPKPHFLRIFCSLVVADQSFLTGPSSILPLGGQPGCLMEKLILY